MKRTLFVFLIVVAALVSRGSSLAESPFCSGALHAQAQGQGPVMPPPGGNPDHSSPAPGAYCDRSKRAAHECACHAKCVENDDGSIRIEEDAKCRAWCYAKYCRCPVADCPSPSETANK